MTEREPGQPLAPAALAEAPQPSDRLRRRVLSSLERRTRFEGFADRFAACTGSSLQVARETLAKIDRPATWQESGIPGHRYMTVEGYGDASADRLTLICIEPGYTFPLHSHPTDELALCIQGGAEVRDGLVLEVGDFVITPADEVHKCHSVRGEPCIMLLRRRAPSAGHADTRWHRD